MIYIKDFTFYGFYRGINEFGLRRDFELYASETAPGQFLAYMGEESGGGPKLYKVCREAPGRVCGCEYNASVDTDNWSSGYYYLMIPDEIVMARNEIAELKKEIARLRQQIQTMENDRSHLISAVRREESVTEEYVNVEFYYQERWREGSIDYNYDGSQETVITRAEYNSLLASGESGIASYIRANFLFGDTDHRIVNASMRQVL